MDLPIINTPQSSTNTSTEIIIESAFDNKLCCLTVSSSTREVIDEFAAIILKRQEGWLPGTIAYYLFDFSKSFASFNTPYGRQRMQDMVRDSRHVSSFVAIVMPNTFIMQIARVVINNFQHRGWTNKLFTDRAEALKWIGAEIAKNEPSDAASN